MLKVALSQSHVGSCYVSRPILSPPQLWLLKHTDLRAHYFAHFPNLISLGSLTLPAPEAGDFVKLIPLYFTTHENQIMPV
jgi:hypothetical protein